jgi:hypothetical protein
MRRFRLVVVTIAGFGLSSGILGVAQDGFAGRTMAAGLLCGTTSRRLSLQGCVFRTIAEAGSGFFASAGRSTRFRFGVTTGGTASGTARRGLVAVVRGDDAGHEGADVARRRGGNPSRWAWRKTAASETPSLRPIAALDLVPQSLRSLAMRLATQNGGRPARRRLRA